MSVNIFIKSLSGTGAMSMLGATLADKATFSGNYGSIFWLGVMFVAIGVGLGLAGRRAE
jgi:hypothetical protein